MNPILAATTALNADSMIRIVIWLVCIGLIFWLLWWLISYVGLPEPFLKVARVVLALAGVIVLIKILLSLAGTPV